MEREKVRMWRGRTGEEVERGVRSGEGEGEEVEREKVRMWRGRR